MLSSTFKCLNMRLIFVFIFISPYTVNAVDNNFSDNKKFDTKINISSQKTQYYIYERILIDFEIINGETTGPRIDNKEEQGWVVKFDGKIILRQFFFSDCLEYKSMKPGELIRGKIDITSVYDLPDSLISGSSNLPCWPIGNYTIQRIWKESGFQPIESNIISIKVIDPPEKEKGALHIFQIANSYEKKKDDLNAIQRYWELVENYPSSIYSELALKRIIILNYFNDDKKCQDVLLSAGKKFLELHPESNDTELVIRSINRYFRKFKNDEKKKEVYEDLINTTKSEKLKKRLEEIVNKID